MTVPIYAGVVLVSYINKFICQVCIFSLYTPVRNKWKAAIENGNILQVKCNNSDGTSTTIRGNPHLITDNAEEAMSGAELVVFMNPAFTHFDFLTHLKPHIQPGMTIIALPGQTGKYWSLTF